MSSRVSVVLMDLLEQLETIEDAHGGLGDTNVRDHMSAHVFRSYLRPQVGFVPDGEYGLSAAANRKIRLVLDTFCSKAVAAAAGDGLTTFRQRLAAFQNPDVRTSQGTSFNDFFGVIDSAQFDENGYPLGQPATPTRAKIIRKLWRFNRVGTIDDLLANLNNSGPWLWCVIGTAEEPWLETIISVDATIQIREEYETMEADGSITFPEFQYISLLKVDVARADDLTDCFLDLLKSAQATEVIEGTDYDW